jgi:hypothetical protein
MLNMVLRLIIISAKMGIGMRRSRLSLAILQACLWGVFVMFILRKAVIGVLADVVEDVMNMWEPERGMKANA